MTDVTIVVPTVGRPCLGRLFAALAPNPSAPVPPARVLVVDDRTDPDDPLAVPDWVTVLPGDGRGPAAARNIGWRAARHEWVVFLDDDVVPGPQWLDDLAADLAAVSDDVGGVQGELRVPLPDRRPTDWERVTAGLADGAWLTADMAYRRAALARVGGFDERLPRAFREDAELAHRVRRSGWSLRRGTRRTTHPVRPEDPWVSVRCQRGNADDALLRRLYGRRWRDVLELPAGRRHRHAAITAAALTAAGATLAALATGNHRWRGLAVLAAAAWGAGTAEFAAARIVPGPRDRREVLTMLATSAVIPPLAVTHWLRGWWTWRGERPLPVTARAAGRRAEPISLPPEPISLPPEPAMPRPPAVRPDRASRPAARSEAGPRPAPARPNPFRSWAPSAGAVR
ncbi:glycosyltransferase family 2 protein [Krasilnikovia sp. MM14-A1004]|uniref:glycosyltransferase family 2 protein n=1 Tax=Krasilnikovia sp. MM14-A1004 TaxID=3373541 RepID=UPI00399D4871